VFLQVCGVLWFLNIFVCGMFWCFMHLYYDYMHELYIPDLRRAGVM